MLTDFVHEKKQRLKIHRHRIFFSPFEMLSLVSGKNDNTSIDISEVMTYAGMLTRQVSSKSLDCWD